MAEDKHYPVESWSLDDAVDQFLAEQFKDGDLIGHDWFLMALDINDSLKAANPFVIVERLEALKTVLLEGHQIALQNVRGRGYRVIPPHEQARYAAEEASRYMARGLRKATSLLSNTRQDTLTAEERQRHTDTQVRISALAGMVSKGRREVFKLFEHKKKD
jgi:hypothetical protein